MARIAVVRQSDNVCINIIVAEISDLAPNGCFLVDIDNMSCDIGWIYDPVVNDFVNPNPPVVEDTIVDGISPVVEDTIVDGISPVVEDTIVDGISPVEVGAV